MFILPNDKGFVIVLALIVACVIMSLATYLLFCSSLDNQIINTSIKSSQASYEVENKINLCLYNSKYLNEELIPRLKYYMRHKNFKGYSNKNKIILDKNDLLPDDTMNTLYLDLFKEEGVLKGSIEADASYRNTSKSAIGIFNVINPIYNVKSPILSNKGVDDENIDNELFNDFTLTDFEDKEEIIEVNNYDSVKLYLTNTNTNKVIIEFYRYGQDIPSQIKYLTKNELFLVIKNDKEHNCQLSIFSEGNNSDNILSGIIYVQGDLNIYDNMTFNGIIGLDSGKLNVYSEEKPNIKGLMILNECGAENIIEEKLNLVLDNRFIEDYGVFLPNFIKPELYLIKEKRCS